MPIVEEKLKTYYKQVKKCLPCNNNEKGIILDTLKSNIDEFIEQNPSSSMNDILKHFGSPELFASEYIGSLESQEVLHKISWKRWLIITGIFILLIVIGLCIWIAFNNSQKVAEVEVKTVINGIISCSLV